MKNKDDRLLFPFTACLIGMLNYIIAIKFLQYDGSDMAIHIELAKDFLQGNSSGIDVYPAFYWAFGLFRAFTNTDGCAAALANSFFSVVCAISVYFIMSAYFQNSQEINESIKCRTVLFISVFGPIVFSGNGVTYYLGQGSFNAWHSPTNNAVKFAALLSFFIFSAMHAGYGEKISENVNRIKYKWLTFLLMVITFVSTLCKPSFCQVFFPAVAIIIIVDVLRKKTTIKNALFEMLALVPSGIVLFWQFLKVFFVSASANNGNGISVQPLLVWSQYSYNIIASIIRAVAFPVFVFLFCYIKNKNRKPCFTYAIIFYLVSVAEYALFAETGERLTDANFQWGMNLAIGILFLSAVFQFIDWNILICNNDDNRVKDKFISFGGNALLSLHFIWGVWYYIELLAIDNLQCF